MNMDMDAKLRWVRVNISDILEGIEELTWEQRGFYLTSLFKMYARMGSIPFDEQDGARVMRCDIRLYRRMRDAMVSAGKFHVRDGQLWNTRVEREIADFCAETKRRQEAAREREKRRKLQDEIGAAMQDFATTSPGLPGEVGETSEGDRQDFSETSIEKSNKNNGSTTTALAQRDHSSGGNQKPETRKKEKYMPIEVIGDDADVEFSSKGRKPYSEQFEEFWKAFPVKDGKWAAFDKSWRKLDAGSKAQAVTAAPLYAARVIAEKIEKPKWAQGWLTERRFEDELRRSAPSVAEQIWWEDPNKVAAITDGQWRGSITKHANGIWPIDKLGPPPGNHRCVVPRHLIAELKLEEKYTSAGISRGKH